MGFVCFLKQFQTGFTGELYFFVDFFEVFFFKLFFVVTELLINPLANVLANFLHLFFLLKDGFFDFFGLFLMLGGLGSELNFELRDLMGDLFGF